MKKALLGCFLLLTGFLFVSAGWAADFDGQGDNQLDSLGYYYAITGGKFPNDQTVNGDNASGGTFRFILDDPVWGRPIQVWTKDDWFPENAGLALTMKNEGSVIFDNFNNDAGDFYSTPAGQASATTPGLYRGYCMSNNYDWIYAGYFKLSEETTIDEIIGYFDENFGFDSNSPHIGYRLNIWSDIGGGVLLPAVNSFAGDVLSSESYPGTFSWGDTGVDRVFGADRSNATDDILYLAYQLDEPITLPAGEYWFSHDAIVTTPIVVNPNPAAVDTDISLSAVVTDPNGDVASAWYSLDGGTEVEMNILNNPYGYDALANATINISEPGIYNLCTYGKGSTGALLPEECTMLVVYDPSGGFVTGGGWIDSPAGAMPSAPTELSMVWDQGFEIDTSGWFDSSNGWFGTITQIPSGTDGVMSSNGAYHAIFEGEVSGAPFSRFDGYRDTWAGTWIAEIDIYIDPAWSSAQGFDYSVASSGSDGTHQRDFIFHVTKDTSADALYVAGSNNTNFAPREDLESINHYEVTTAGWYTLQHVFYDQGGALAVDLNLLDSDGTVLFTETRYNPNDVIPDDVGGNRYAWFTFNNVDNGISVDDHQLFSPVGVSGKANFGFVSKYKKGAIVPTGSTEFMFKAGDLNFHSNEYNWLVVNQGGTNAQYKGVGTINGTGAYKFMIWASDGEDDTFRIKIWYEDNGSEVVVYDNGVGQVISGGNIVVHTKKK